LRQEIDKEKGELELSSDGSEEDISAGVSATKHTKKGGNKEYGRKCDNKDGEPKFPSLN
jgi:hypothetical protein